MTSQPPSNASPGTGPSADGPSDRGPTAHDDVRMRGFARRTTVDATWKWLDARTSPLEGERVGIATAAGRVLVQDLTSLHDVPAFDRSMMDGIAVRAEDTLGASPYNRLRFTVIGEALPGRDHPVGLGPGEAVTIMTGAPIPPGATAVLPAERVEWQGRLAWALDEVPPGKNIGRRGEDVPQGTRVLPAGRRLRPQDVGVLASIGLATVLVHRRPRVRLVVTGNELLSPGEALTPGKILDANGPMLQALVERDGGIPVHPGIVPDDADAILAAMRSDADIVLVSGGSSVGQEDFAPQAVAQFGELPIHGVAMRPSSPTGLGLLDGRLVCLLPGNPVSCLCAY